ncbi:EAL domain-containing protein [Marinobacterium stanieri]|uniref:bifunctional diguanylate cyclase/phosphodiesterase n=1 Tax=Marinobacterium stanieri TaxID=49186 RepID=UPI003A8EE61C
MAALKRNLWTLFWLILFGGAVLLSVILYARWQSIYDEHKTYHQNRAELISQAVNSVLHTQELVLDVIGRELLSNEQMFDNSQQLPLLDNILAVDKSMLGFGLARPDGTLVRVSSNLDLSKLPNLRTQPASAASFEQALQSNKMVLGRTYFLPALDAWVIPIRKALRSPNGEVLAVMTGGLRMNTPGSVFSSSVRNRPNDIIKLYREADGYLQYIAPNAVGPAIYTRPQITTEQRDENRQGYTEEIGMTVDEVKALDRAVSFSNEYDGEAYITAAIFNRRYQLWTLSETSLTPLKAEFRATLLQYLTVFILIFGVLYALFRVIHRAERERREELLYHSCHDDLTGLLNRAGLFQVLDEQVERQHSFCLVIINIDHFKGINDRFGQDIGDETLVAFSDQLTVLCGTNPGNHLARLGGDEFVIVSENTNPNEQQRVCEELLKDLATNMAIGRLNLQLTASAGIAFYPGHGDSTSKLLRSAHLALYRAKNNRNSVSLYRSEMEMDYLRQLVVEQRLRLALTDKHLHMVYQPQVDNEGLVVGLEALVRWQDEELGAVSPQEFVGVAEQSGLMLSLGHFVLDTSLKEYAELREKLGHGLDLAINISVIQFEQPQFVKEVMHLLHTHQVPPQELVLEITESLVMTNVDQVLNTIKRLQDQGIRLSMDDFGTGFSSLSLLRDLPLNELKVDKSFVDSMLDDPRAANMIRSIIFIAQSHAMDVVVEGVELQAQAEKLMSMGCRRFQGYYFSRPERLERILEICTQDSRGMPFKAH